MIPIVSFDSCHVDVDEVMMYSYVCLERCKVRKKMRKKDDVFCCVKSIVFKEKAGLYPGG